MSCPMWGPRPRHKGDNQRPYGTNSSRPWLSRLPSKDTPFWFRLGWGMPLVAHVHDTEFSIRGPKAKNPADPGCHDVLRRVALPFFFLWPHLHDKGFSIRGPKAKTSSRPWLSGRPSTPLGPNIRKNSDFMVWFSPSFLFTAPLGV